jgi:hypothetical protein
MHELLAMVIFAKMVTSGYFYDTFAYEICFWGYTSMGLTSMGYTSTRHLNF